MREFLEKIKLIEYLTTEIEIQKNEFVSKFRNHVDEESTGIFSGTFEVFSSSKNEYKGHVGFDGFKIKRRRRFFDRNMSMAVASGNYKQNNEILIIETKINGFSRSMIPFYLFGILFYSIFIGAFFLTENIEGNAVGIGIPFIIIHAALMFGIPYFMMRSSTKK